MYITYMQQTFIHETMLGNAEKIFVYIYIYKTLFHRLRLPLDLYDRVGAYDNKLILLKKCLEWVLFLIYLFIYLFLNYEKSNPHYSTPSLEYSLYILLC